MTAKKKATPPKPAAKKKTTAKAPKRKVVVVDKPTVVTPTPRTKTGKRPPAPKLVYRHTSRDQFREQQSALDHMKIRGK